MATRRESVVLSLQDDLSPGMLRAAAATKLLDRELNSLSKSGTVVNRRLDTLSGRADKVGASLKGMNTELGHSGKSLDALASSSLPRTAAAADRTDGSINQLTGRLRVLGEVAAILGPSLTPIGGVAIAGVAGLANQMGVAAIAGGVLIGSMQGLGDALDALNKADLEPTAENLAKAEDALNRLAPAAADFAREANGLMPALRAIRDMGSEALFPGLSESLESLESLGPRVAQIFEAVAGALGSIASDSAASLASDRWADFFMFIQTEAPRTLGELASTVGDLTHGLSELWQAFTPLNDDFSGWLMDVADGFDEWATGLDQTQGFQEFIDYVRETGPRVAETFGAIFNAVVQIVQATAPLGGPVLSALESVADIIGAIADSDIGTPILAGVAALSLLNRSLAVTASLSKVSLSSGLFAGLGTVGKGASGGLKSLRADISAVSDKMVVFGANTEKADAATKRLKGQAATFGKSAALLGGLAVAGSGAADSIGLSNTASLALMGTIAGPWGAAVGGGIGLLLDMKAAGDQAEAATAAFNTSLESLSLDQLNAGLAQANALLGAAGDGLAGDLISGRIQSIEDQIDATKELDAAKLAAQETDRGTAIALARQAGLNIDVSNSAEVSAEKIKKQTKAYQEAQQAARDAARTTARGFVTIGDSVDDAKVSLDEWIASLADQANALNSFMDNAKTASKRGLRNGLIQDLQDAGPAGALRMRQLANATDDEIARANRAWKRGQDAIRDYVNFKVPPKKITVDQVAAMSAIERIRLALAGLKDKNVTVRVTQTGAAVGETVGGPRPGVATGGHITGPGTGTSDSIPAYLSNGEFVIKAAAVKHYGADTFHGLNAMRFADGGSVDRKGDKKKPVRGVAFYSPDNTNALQAAIDRLTDVASTQTEALEAATSAQEFWAGKMSDLAQATVSGFNTGLFDRDSNPWAAGAGGGPISNLTSDIAGLTERQGLQTQLAGMGISGDTLAALLSQGTNADISGLIASGQVGQYADLYAQRAALQGSVGQQAGQAAYGMEAAAAQAEVRAIAAESAKTNLELVRLNTQMARNTAAVEKFESTGPERTGAAAGAAMRGEVVKGHRERVNQGVRPA